MHIAKSCSIMLNITECSHLYFWRTPNVAGTSLNFACSALMLHAAYTLRNSASAVFISYLSLSCGIIISLFTDCMVLWPCKVMPLLFLLHCMWFAPIKIFVLLILHCMWLAFADYCFYSFTLLVTCTLQNLTSIIFILLMVFYYKILFFYFSHCTWLAPCRNLCLLFLHCVLINIRNLLLLFLYYHVESMLQKNFPM